MLFVPSLTSFWEVYHENGKTSKFYETISEKWRASGDIDFIKGYIEHNVVNFPELYDFTNNNLKLFVAVIYLTMNDNMQRDPKLEEELNNTGN